MIQISSASNDHFKRLCTLKNSKGIRDHGEFILMGENLVREFLKRKNNPWKIKAEVVHEDLQPLTDRGTTHFHLAKALFKEVDVLGTQFNLLVLQNQDLERSDLQQNPMGLELVCPLGDPGNLGAVLRSALAFGVSQVLLTEEAANPFHQKAVKASSGAVLQIPMKRTGPMASYRSPGKSFALDMHGMAIEGFQWPMDLRLLIGEEGPGLPELKEIPRIAITTNNVESLNATVAASLAFYSYRLKHHLN